MRSGYCRSQRAYFYVYCKKIIFPCHRQYHFRQFGTQHILRSASGLQKKRKKKEKEKQWSQRKHCLAKLLNQGLYFGRRKMLHPQRSLSELPKMSAASQVERAVLVSSSDRETHSDYLLKPTVSCFILTQPIACRFRDILLFSSWSQQRETILNVGEARG